MFRSAGLVAPAAALLLAGCGASSGGSAGSVASTSTAATIATVRQPMAQGTREPEFQSIPGLEGVIGATSAQLISQFGDPRLDVLEGDVRKLQYAGAACVLDIYLYPTSRGREPLATYVDARRASDGQDVDRAACVRAMRR